jgi:hypothetical protein
MTHREREERSATRTASEKETLSEVVPETAQTRRVIAARTLVGLQALGLWA